MRILKRRRKPDRNPAGKRIFFYHLPKCAGTSLWAGLRDIVGKERVFQVWSEERAQQFRALPASERSSYHAIGGHYELDLYQTHLDLENYLCVTTFREPVQRLLSEHHYASRNPQHSHHAIIAGMSLAEFTQWRPNPITTLICGKPDAKAAAAVVSDVFDHWAFVEEIDELFARLCDSVGRPSKIVPRLNLGSAFGAPSTRSSELDPELLDLIREHHHADIELYAKLKELRARASRSSAVALPAERASSPVFRVVTPALNGARYFDETIESVVGQSGDFVLHYHIQDGGSSDGTVEIARRWQSRVQSQDFPRKCREIRLTVDSRPDAGMYDAIAAGFRSLAPAERDLMTWINADDRLAVGALRAVADAAEDLPDAELIGGRQALLDADGQLLPRGSTVGYPREAVAAGLHDGRHLPFIMQEGTFWRAALWERVGGVDTSFRLAGDWDLWRRFAAETDYVTLDAVTAYHRRHAGQLSGDIAAYHRELDDRLAGERELRDAVFQRYLKAWVDASGESAGSFSVRVARRGEAGKWGLVDWKPPKPVNYKAPRQVRLRDRIRSLLPQAVRPG